MTASRTAPEDVLIVGHSLAASDSGGVPNEPEAEPVEQPGRPRVGRVDRRVDALDAVREQVVDDGGDGLRRVSVALLVGRQRGADGRRTPIGGWCTPTSPIMRPSRSMAKDVVVTGTGFDSDVVVAAVGEAGYEASVR